MGKIGWMGAGMAVLFSVSALAADPGKVVSASKAEVERAGTKRELKAGDAIQTGDQLTTANRGQLSWVMDDGAMAAMSGNSTMTLDGYTKPASATSGGGRLLMSLTRGAFRAISGLVGKIGSDEYRVDTPVATMGIRGTTYSAAWCQDDCSEASRGAAGTLANGLYVLVEDGVVEIVNPAGRLRVNAGQRAYVASLNDAPVLIKFEPQVFLELEQIMSARLRLFEGLPVGSLIQIEIDVEPPASPSSPP